MVIKNNLENYDDICEPEKYDDLNIGYEYVHDYEEVKEHGVENDDIKKNKEISDETKEENSIPLYSSIDLNV
jgi:hypothetical protein